MTIDHHVFPFPTLATLDGVAYTAPPPHLIAEAIAHGAIVAVGNRDGVNAALAVHGPLGVEIHAWIGKSWSGPIDYGVTAVKTF